jgi:hypothetical protein
MPPRQEEESAEIRERPRSACSPLLANRKEKPGAVLNLGKEIRRNLLVERAVGDSFAHEAVSCVWALVTPLL